MDREQLRSGRVFDASLPGFDRLMHLSGVPRACWGVSREHVSFEPFKERRTWKKDPDLYKFEVSAQKSIYDGMLASITGHADKNFFDAYAGSTIMISSQTTQRSAQQAASLIVRTLLDSNQFAHVQWYDATEMDRWGRPVHGKWDNVPDMVCVGGLHPEPTREVYATVQRLREWAIRFCPCIMIGSGTNPVDLAVTHYRIVPDVGLFCSGGAARTTSVG